MLKKTVTSLLIACSFNSFAHADCQGISDDGERLACYDNLLSEKQMLHPQPDAAEASDVKPPEEFDLDTMNFSQITSYFDDQKLLKLTPHHPSYMLPVSYNNNPNSELFEELKPDLEFDKMEVKFQISGKVKLWDDLYKDNWDIWVGYTQIAWWQLYNTAESAPFRDTNYSPEIFASYYSNFNILGFTLLQSDFGIIHQSNGRPEFISRSWNRIYANFQLAKGNFIMTLQPWYRIPEDADDDDNPDIHKYMGYGNYRFSYKDDDIIYSMLLRNNFRADGNKGAVELSWAFPLYETVQFYVQYFNGYGESLLDYNHSSNRLSLGILLYDWI